MTPMNKFEDQFPELTTLYENLTRSVFDFEIPFLQNLRRLIKPFCSPNTSNLWQKYLRLTYRLYTPLRASSFLEFLSGIWKFTLVGYIEFVWGIVGISFAIFFSHQVNLPTSTQTNNNELWLIILLGLAHLLLLPATLKRWQVLITDQNYHLLVRIILTLGLIGILATTFSSPVIYKLKTDITFSTLLSFYASNYLITLILLVLLLPSTTFFYTNLIDAVIWILWVFGAGIFAFSLFHSPLTMKQVRTLVFDGKKLSDGKVWKLADIPNLELNALQKLAESNRDGTDKRLVPTAIFLGLIQFLGWDWISKNFRINELWNAILQILSTRNFISTLVASTAFGIMLALFFLFVTALIYLISNLVTQSIIIEACIVAKYENEKQLSIQSSIGVKANSKKFWTRIGEFLDSLF